MTCHHSFVRFHHHCESAKDIFYDQGGRNGKQNKGKGKRYSSAYKRRPRGITSTITERRKSKQNAGRKKDSSTANRQGPRAAFLTYLPPTRTTMAAATARRTNTMTNAATTSPTDHGSIIRTLPNAATTSRGPTPWRLPGDAANSFDSATIFYGTEAS